MFALLLRLTNSILEGILFLLLPFLNMVLYLDLYLIIKNPFYPQSKRIFRYNIIIGCIIIIGISNGVIYATYNN